MVSRARGRTTQAVVGGALIALFLTLTLLRPALRSWLEGAGLPGLGWGVLVLAWACLVAGVYLVARARSDHSRAQ